jgi:hypothetical protein
MQKMLDLCDVEAASINMCFNVTKSAALRLGLRCRRPCAPLLLAGTALTYADNIKYLGVTILKGCKFACSYQHMKMSFYRAFNMMYAKSKAANSELISVYLLKSMCIPIIMYAVEATCPNKGAISSLSCAIDNALRKIFSVNEQYLINYIKSCLGIQNTRDMYFARLLKFISRWVDRTDMVAKVITSLAFDDIKPILNELDISRIGNKKAQLKAAITAVYNRSYQS